MLACLPICVLASKHHQAQEDPHRLWLQAMLGQSVTLLDNVVIEPGCVIGDEVRGVGALLEGRC